MRKHKHKKKKKLRRKERGEEIMYLAGLMIPLTL
jgi:hypothetical protein